jgi:hypothetical protein
MRVEYVLVAEAATNDLRGALALIGVNQRALIGPKLPFNAQLRVVIMLTDETDEAEGQGFEESRNAQLSINVIDPEGDSRSAWNEPVNLPTEKRWVDLPMLANVIVDVPIRGNAYGIYLIEVRYTPSDDEEQKKRIPLYVVPQPMNLIPDAPSKAFGDKQVIRGSID